MCKIISSDSIIGNFVIEALEKDDFKIDLEKLYDFDEQLSANLEKHNYYTKFDLIEVIDFSENYPFLIESLDNDCFHIVKNIGDKARFQSMLLRYFRFGMPKIVIDEMKSISQAILG